MMLNGFRDIVQKYDYFIFDLWGVLYEGGPIFQDALHVLRQLNYLNKQVILISNSPYSSIYCAENLQKCGLPAELYKTVITAGDICKEYIKSEYKNSKKFYLIDSFYWETWNGIRSHHSSTENINEADAFLCLAIPDNIKTLQDIHYQYVDIFTQAICLNLPLLCANPDMFAPAPKSKKLQMRPGLLTNCYKQLGGNVLNFGKPFPEIFDQALKLIENQDKVLMTGDTEYTDINGALNQNIDSLLITEPYGNNQIFTSRATYFSKTLKW